MKHNHLSALHLWYIMLRLMLSVIWERKRTQSILIVATQCIESVNKYSEKNWQLVDFSMVSKFYFGVLE